MKRVVLASAALVALAGTAVAADLPLSGPAPYYKAPAYAPAYNWSGFYVGINGGGGWGRSIWTSTGGFDTSGGLVGGTIGYNYQMNQVVLGVEGDIDWANISGSTAPGCTAINAAGCQTSNSWLSTVRARLGYAADRFMPYITAGAAFGDITASGPGLTGIDNTNAGWTAGGGIEFAIIGHWTAKAEYLFVDLGKTSCGLACGAVIQNVSFDANIFRGGINYRF
jgi:outer membrane immunogenic protein